MADVTAVSFLFCKLPVIIWKVCDPVLILLLKNRIKDGSKLGQITAGPARITGLCRCLDAGFPVHVFGDALMDRPVLIDQVVVIFVIRIKILKLPFTVAVSCPPFASRSATEEERENGTGTV